jgi:putative thioredoxin
MLELGQSQTPDAGAGDLIKDGTEATFMADVIEGSRETPVIVDFWATWCGPCKTLAPMLEAAVTAAKGKVRMIKIDVDKEQRLAGAWRSRACRCSRSRRSSPSSAASPWTCSRARSRKARSTSS